MPKRLTAEQRAHRELSEKQFQGQVIQLANRCGWRHNHNSDSRKVVRRGNRMIVVPDPDAGGLPDLILVHPKHGVAFLELKKEVGWKVKPKQDDWLRWLREANQVAVLVRPSDMDLLVGWLAHGFDQPAYDFRYV